MEPSDVPDVFGEEVRKHLDQYKNPKVRASSLSAWRLLYDTLKEAGYVPEELGDVVFSETGKPSYKAENRPCFSLSHSGGVCAAAVYEKPVGVDLERIRADYPASMVKKCLSEAEAALYDGEFTPFWCRKEAMAKLTGEGIYGYPDKINTLSDEVEFIEERITHEGSDFYLAAVIERGL